MSITQSLSIGLEAWADRNMTALVIGLVIVAVVIALGEAILAARCRKDQDSDLPY
jgi:hypothetical protein